MAKLFLSPVFKHDCEACRFVATMVEETPGGLQISDVYLCGDEGDESLICRTADDGPEYRSMALETVAFHTGLGNDMGTLSRALRLTEAMGKVAEALA